jgi:gluconokinase
MRGALIKDSKGQPAPGVVVFGVAGCGKTTLGRILAARLEANFFDADAYHPLASVARMRAGQPLTDADRIPWLNALNELLHGPEHAATPLVLACSALRRSYRGRLRDGPRPLRWIFLEIDPATLAGRLRARRGHFFNPVLLESQIATLEAPENEDAVLRMDAGMPVDALAAMAVRWLCSSASASGPDWG